MNEFLTDLWNYFPTEWSQWNWNEHISSLYWRDNIFITIISSNVLVLLLMKFPAWTKWNASEIPLYFCHVLCDCYRSRTCYILYSYSCRSWSSLKSKKRSLDIRYISFLFRYHNNCIWWASILFTCEKNLLGKHQKFTMCGCFSYHSTCISWIPIKNSHTHVWLHSCALVWCNKFNSMSIAPYSVR